MKLEIFLAVSFCIIFNAALGQLDKGKVVYERLYSESLENDAGENPERRVTIYLPPNYDNSSQRYPVMYYLHGFTWSDSMQVAGDHFDQLLDRAINEGILRPLIVVMPDHHTLYRGSYYTNSSYTGNWADFTAIDLVNFIDENYRTISKRESRGIAGHSMGGYGALKIAMQYPETFSITYGLSPATISFIKEWSPSFNIFPSYNIFKRVSELKTREEVVTGLDEFLPNAAIAMARTFSPNPDNPPFYADFPFEYVEDSLIVRDDVIKLWEEHCLVNMVSSHVENLRKLKAIKFDWGRNEEFGFIPVVNLRFSQELEQYGIKHFPEVYLGNHTNMLWTEDGRAMRDLFPFFDNYLKFEW